MAKGQIPMSETTTAGDPAPTPTTHTFSADYVRELRAENRTTRLKAQELEAQLQQATEAGKKLADEFAAKQTSISDAAKAAMTRSELKVHALKAGMVDLDGLKLLDLSSIKLTDTGEIENAEAILKAAKEAKPWLFSMTTANTTSSTSQPPKPAEPKIADARNMSDDDLAAFEKQHGIKTQRF
jgi:cell division septum initiation protein DivIVA